VRVAWREASESAALWSLLAINWQRWPTFQQRH
jgi:hypothetical protein